LNREVIQMAEKRIFFEADGLKIEGMLADSPGDHGVVISHPHPLYGGTMHNNVVRAVVHAYQEEGYSALRFNFRGVENSEGDFGNGVGEQEDVKAALKAMGKKHMESPWRTCRKKVETSKRNLMQLLLKKN